MIYIYINHHAQPPIIPQHCCCLKKNQNTPRPSEHPPVMGGEMSKRLGGIKGCKYKCCFSHSAHWLPTRKKLLYTVANPACGLLNRKNKTKRKSLAAPPPHPPQRAARSEKKKKKKKITRRILMSRRYACDAMYNMFFIIPLYHISQSLLIRINSNAMARVFDQVGVFFLQRGDLSEQSAVRPNIYIISGIIPDDMSWS